MSATRLLARIAATAASTGVMLAAQASDFESAAKGASEQIKAYDSSVTNVSTIIGEGAGVKTNCGVTKNEPFEAFYCGTGGSVIVFSKAALENIGRAKGKTAVMAVVAHEFGHARQHMVSGFTSNTIWTASVDELQADCIAGVYMRNIKSLELTEEELDSVSDFMKDIGSYVFTERDWHGSPEMRSASFRYGYRSGDMNRCLATKENNWGKAVESLDNEIKRVPARIDSLLKWGSDILK